MAKKATEKKSAKKVSEKEAKAPAKKWPSPPAVEAQPTPPARTFAHPVEVNTPTAEQAAARARAKVVATANNKTAIELRRGDLVVFIPHSEYGFDVVSMKPEEFDMTYKVIEGYPSERAAKLYVGYSQTLGGTPAAMDELANLVTVSDQERSAAMAKNKKTVAETPAATKSTGKKVAAKKAPADGKKRAAGGGRKGNGIGTFIKELIMAHKLSDDEIFKEAQKKFGLEDHKRSHIGWYRFDMKRKGLKPPESVNKAS